jgi:hypothetical protein
VTTPTIHTPDVGADPVQTEPRPGSRAARMAHPMMLHAIRQVAADHGVCVRPTVMRRTDLATGQTEVIDIPCNNTLEVKCPSCAKRKKRLRTVQLREGWHRADEPNQSPTVADDQEGLILLRANFEYARTDCLAHGRWDQVAELDDAIAEIEALTAASGIRGQQPSTGPGGTTADPDSDGESGKRRRSTRRRQDVPDLPRRKVVARTVGRTFASKDGRTFQPSTFLTLTLGSYGRVRADGSPIDPSSYDYRRAAWDAVHFPALLDRFWQNLRRAEGWNVQYFGSLEPQRRLAPHAHFAIRGTMPHAMLRQVVAATYHNVWWPKTDTVVYPGNVAQPVWDPDCKTYKDAHTGTPLPTWEEAMATLDDELAAEPDREPEYVIRFGTQLKPVGVLAGTPQAGKLVGYLSKYITKSVADCHAIETAQAEAHQRRLWEELRYTPCSPRCPNWLRYGIQPDKAKAKQRAGHCKAKVHQPATLGIGGRRILVSRNWSGKTLADHRYDQLAWVRQTLRVGLAEKGENGDEDQAVAVEAAREGGAPAPIVWEMARPDDRDVPNLARRLLQSISTRIQHRERLRAAQARAGAPPGNVSATDSELGEAA